MKNIYNNKFEASDFRMGLGRLENKQLCDRQAQRRIYHKHIYKYKYIYTLGSVEKAFIVLTGVI